MEYQLSTHDGRTQLQICSVDDRFYEWLRKNPRNDIFCAPEEKGCLDLNGAVLIGKIPSKIESTKERTFGEIENTITNAIQHYRLQYSTKEQDMYEYRWIKIGKHLLQEK